MALCKPAWLFVQQVRDAQYSGDGRSYKSFLWLTKLYASLLSNLLRFHGTLTCIVEMQGQPA